jgi:Putative Ig domain
MMVCRSATWESARVKTCALPLPLVVAVTLALFSGCSSGESANSDRLPRGPNNHAPVVKSVAILPSPLVLSEPLTVLVEAQDSDLNTINFRYRWLANGTIITGQTRESLPPELLKRGDQVIVEVTPFDGVAEGAPFRSASVPVMNTAPILSRLSVEIDHEAQGGRLLAKVDVVDPDNDPVSLVYRWRKDEKVLKEGEDNTLPITGLTAKDLIQVDVTASDGNTDGAATLSGQFTMSNSSPTITSKPSLSPNGNVFEYLVQASDPDGDPITYGLEVSPPGMTIDEKTGRVHWMVTPEAKGSYRIKVVAKDSQGGFASQEFDLSVNAPKRTS